MDTLDPLLTQLLEIWKRILQTDRIGVDESFFTIGGNSMKALKLLLETEKKFGRKLTVDFLIEGTTIQKQADYLRRHQIFPFRYMVALQKNGDRPPVFAVPGYFFYQQLSAHLGDRQPFYGFEPTESRNLKTIAEEYIGELLQICPEGPFILAGYCSGGETVLEMGHQLHAMGKPPLLAILFETYTPDSVYAKTSWPYIRQKVSFIGKTFLAQPTWSEKIKFIDREIFKVYKKIGQKSGVAEEAPVYDYRIYPGDVLLIRAKEKMIGSNDDPFMGWRKLVTGNLSIHDVAGDHASMFKAPFVQELADVLHKKISNLTEADGIEKKVPGTF